jgi:hypothetical protein
MAPYIDPLGPPWGLNKTFLDPCDVSTWVTRRYVGVGREVSKIRLITILVVHEGFGVLVAVALKGATLCHMTRCSLVGTSESKCKPTKISKKKNRTFLSSYLDFPRFLSK